MLKAPMGGGGGGNFDRKICPAGNHTAVCFGVVDIGTHLKRSRQYGDKWTRQVLLRWELSDELVKGDDGVERPMVISQRYTLSLNERAALRGLIHSWLAQKLTDEQAAQFDLHGLAGMPCQIVVTHDEKDGKVYDNVASVGPLPRRMQPPPQVNPTMTYSLEDGPPPGDWPQWLRDLIGRSQEMGGGAPQPPPGRGPQGEQPSGVAADAPAYRPLPVPSPDDEVDIPF